MSLMKFVRNFLHNSTGAFCAWHTGYPAKWRLRNEEIPYWWHVITQMRVVLLIGWSKFPSQHDQSEALPRSGWWRVISVQLVSQTSFRGNIDCFLRPIKILKIIVDYTIVTLVFVTSIIVYWVYIIKVTI